MHYVTMTNEEELVELANAKMPFGKYAGRYLVDLPETYVLWFKGKGFPEGKLGRQLAAIQEIQENGLEALIRPLIGRRDGEPFVPTVWKEGDV
jgi:uncharacterized protein (DUF3820 family)